MTRRRCTKGLSLLCTGVPPSAASIGVSFVCICFLFLFFLFFSCTFDFFRYLSFNRIPVDSGGIGHYSILNFVI